MVAKNKRTDKIVDRLTGKYFAPARSTIGAYTDPVVLSAQSERDQLVGRLVKKPMTDLEAAEAQLKAKTAANIVGGKNIQGLKRDKIDLVSIICKHRE